MRQGNGVVLSERPTRTSFLTMIRACMIDNPLSRLNPDEVEDRAETFTLEHDLVVHKKLIVKAMRILRDPEAWESVERLDGDERDALRGETDRGFWGQPKELKVTIIALCVSGIVQGWTQTSSNGANLNWPKALDLFIQACDPKGKDAWIFAIVNAAPYLSSSLIGCWLSDPLNEYFLGRRSAICISAFLILAASIGSACSLTWPQLLACRILLGMGMGAKASVTPVFAAEVSPAFIRGSLVMNWQVADAFGILLGFSANLVVSQIGPLAWRFQMVSAVLPTTVLLALIWVASESPRFLMKQGKYLQAFRSLTLLRGHPILAAKELLHVHFQMKVEGRFIGGNQQPSDPGHDAEPKGEVQGARSRNCVCGVPPSRSINYWQRLGQLFTIPRIRRATIAAVVCMVSQQLCGVNVLAIYSSTLFCDAGSDANKPGEDLRPLFLSWGIGLVNFLFAIPAYWLIDTRGRRWLVLVGLPLMAMCMLGAALSFTIPTDNHARGPVIGLFTYLFMMVYSPTMGPVPFTLSAEVFPLENRVVGMSFSVFTNMLGLGLLTLFVPIISVHIHNSGLLGIFAGLNVVAFVLIFFFVRETAGAALGHERGSLTFMSLEELNYLFGVSTKKHALYQWHTVVPWIWAKYVLHDKTSGEAPEQLYTWSNAREATEGQAHDLPKDN